MWWVMIDQIDRQILLLLQENARISNAELAEQVNLSATPCLRRVKRLEQEGLIKQYVAELDKDKLGLQISAFVFIQLERNSYDNAAAFEQEMALLPEVMDCFVLTGSHDYLLRVVSQNLGTYEQFIKKKLAAVKQIAKIDTTIVLNQVKGSNQLPLPPI